MYRSALLTFFLVLQVTQQCGMLVHQDVSERALQAFESDSKFPYKEVLNNHHDFVQAGSPFPDWGYLCKTPAGEDSHWPPFVEAYKKYLTDNYEEGSEQYNKLVAFLFGVESHIEADVIWHWGKASSTSSSQGFLQSMSHVASDCDDDWNSGSQKPNCHSDGDIGADFYLGGRGGTAWLQHKWKVPAKDLAKIYKTMNLMNETSLKITGCTSIMFIGSVLEQYFTSYVTSKYDQHTAFLTEDLDLWFHGGLEDMASNVAWKWTELTNLLDDHRAIKEAPQEKKPDCTVFGKDFLPDHFGTYAELIGFTMTEDQDGNTEFGFDPETLLKNEVTLLDKVLKDSNLKVEQPDEELGLPSNLKPVKTLQGQENHSYYGKSVTTGDYKQNGNFDTFISAPGYGRPGLTQQGAVYKGDELWLEGPGDYTRFGQNIVTLDIDRDGIDDLVVSAPAYGKGGPTEIGDYYPKEYNGRVYVYRGRKDEGVLKGAQPDIVIQNQHETDPFFNMGQGLRVHDCDGDGLQDLLILSPLAQEGGNQRGHIAIVTGIESGQSTFFLKDAQFSLSGDTNYQHFGYDAVCTVNKEVVVGIPGSRGPQKQQGVGEVRIYDFKTKQLINSIKSTEDQSQFGQSLAYNPDLNYLAVGAPTRRNDKKYNSGAIYIYNLDKHPKFEEYQSTIQASLRGARFGKRISWFGNHIVVSAPSQTSVLSLKVPNDQGKIYFYLNAHVLHGNLSSSTAKYTFTTSQAGCKHGDSMYYKKGQLIVSSPTCHNVINKMEKRLSGSVTFFDLTFVADSQNKFLEY